MSDDSSPSFPSIVSSVFVGFTSPKLIEYLFVILLNLLSPIIEDVLPFGPSSITI